MANLQATLRARLPHEMDLAVLANKLDREIEASTATETYVTLFMAILESGSHRLRYVNAGHNAQYAFGEQGRLDRLPATGRPLGLLPGGGYTEANVELGEGDCLFFYTDGLVETENEGGEPFGEQRLEQLLLEKSAGGVDEVLPRVEERVRAYRGNAATLPGVGVSAVLHMVTPVGIPAAEAAPRHRARQPFADVLK